MGAASSTVIVEPEMALDDDYEYMQRLPFSDLKSYLENKRFIRDLEDLIWQLEGAWALVHPSIPKQAQRNQVINYLRAIPFERYVDPRTWSAVYLQGEEALSAFRISMERAQYPETGSHHFSESIAEIGEALNGISDILRAIKQKYKLERRNSK